MLLSKDSTLRILQRTIAIVLSTLALSACSGSPEQSTAASISVEGDQLIWRGTIDNAGVERARDLIETSDISYVNIQSHGGNPMAAMQFGYIIHRNNMTLQIHEECLEACANYLFTAAAKRILPEEALIAWSGGALEASWTRQWGSFVVPGIRGAIEKYTDSYLRRETRFFDRIGVDQRITFYGYDDRLGCMADSTRGFYYSPGDLLSMGVGQTEMNINDWESRYLEYDDEFCRVDLSNRLPLVER